MYILDNEISKDFKEALKKYNITFQLTPPHIHQRNAAERAICTFKNHFLAGLASCDPKFPAREWDRLLDQTTLTLNLLRNSRVNPALSAYAYSHGIFNFNATSLAPRGTCQHTLVPNCCQLLHNLNLKAPLLSVAASMGTE